MNRKTGEATVDYAEAVRRVQAGFRGPVFNISVFADLVWPNHTMRRQGAALAVSFLVHRMRQDGVIHPIIERGSGRGGWELTRGPW